MTFSLDSDSDVLLCAVGLHALVVHELPCALLSALSASRGAYSPVELVGEGAQSETDDDDHQSKIPPGAR